LVGIDKANGRGWWFKVSKNEDERAGPDCGVDDEPEMDDQDVAFPAWKDPILG